MESALPSKSQPGLDEVDNYAICVEAGAKGEKRKPQSKYTDKDGYKIAKWQISWTQSSIKLFPR